MSDHTKQADETKSAYPDGCESLSISVSGEATADVPATWLSQVRTLAKYKRSALAALGCSTTPILIGYDLTLVGSIIANKEFVKTFGTYDEAVGALVLPANQQLVWTIVQFVAAAAWALGAGALNDFLGRRICFFITVILTIAGTFAELFSTNWKLWIVAKLLMGAAMGSMQGTTQTYVSELTPVAIRGFALSLFQFWIILGSLIAACVLQGTSSIDGPWSWKAAVVTQFLPALLCILVYIPFVPESPYFLISKGRFEAAHAAINRLRPASEGHDPEGEVQAIKATLDHEREGRSADRQSSYLECFQGTNLRRTMIACLPIMSQLFMGYPLCGNYLAYFLTNSGVDDPFVITVISMVCALLSASVAFVLVERVGRRPQLLVGSYGMIACLLVVGILGFFGQGTMWNSRVLATFCIIWALFYYVSVGAIGWTIVGEISSPRLRAKTTSLAAISSSIFNMVWSIAIPYLVNAEEANLGAKSGLIFFGFSVLFGAATFFCVPETKGKTFDQLDHLFAARTPTRKF